MTPGINCIKNSLGDNFSYVTENVAASAVTDVCKVFLLFVSCASGDKERSHKKRHHPTVSLAFCFSEMSDKTSA
jgi:hypothetical protein